MYKSAWVLLRGHGYHKGVTSIIGDPITQPIRKAVAGVNVYDQKMELLHPFMAVVVKMSILGRKFEYV